MLELAKVSLGLKSPVFVTQQYNYFFLYLKLFYVEIISVGFLAVLMIWATEVKLNYLKPIIRKLILLGLVNWKSLQETYFPDKIIKIIIVAIILKT